MYHQVSDMDSSRHFLNSNPEFDPKMRGGILSESGETLSEVFGGQLRSRRNQLLRKLYDEYGQIKDEDCSVYTGITKRRSEDRNLRGLTWLLKS